MERRLCSRIAAVLFYTPVLLTKYTKNSTLFYKHSMPTSKKKKTIRTPIVTKERSRYAPYTPVDFKDSQRSATALAELIEARFEELSHILLEYESYEVVTDEISRTLDLLRNLKENKDFFKLRVGEVTTFLPRNQPLYALTCFVLVPSLMASEVHFRIPHSMRHFFPKLLARLDVYQQFPNVIVSHNQRLDFLRERSALRTNPKTGETVPVTDVVIFTGTSVHADQLRFIFDDRTLFITNGSGHNPIIVSKDADIRKAVEATLTLQLYNQGQDCAAPNAVLVHKNIFPLFLQQLRDSVRTVGVGDYRDRICRVGPISDPTDLVRIQDFLIENRQWLDVTTPGIIRSRTAILEPTIVTKPLTEGGNYSEIFAPVIFLQEYEKDTDLALYFENKRYVQNAMYVTLYGTSAYIRKLIGRVIEGKVVHDTASFLHNIHLHVRGVERGTQPYGGMGYGASSLSINGKIMCQSTLAQRDIYNWVAKPLLNKKVLEKHRSSVAGCTDVVYKDVQKLLRLKTSDQSSSQEALATGLMYIDIDAVSIDGVRYIKVDEEYAYQLLTAPNAEYITRLAPQSIKVIRALRALLLEQRVESSEEFKTRVYALPVKPGISKEDKKSAQLQFFQNVYQLLFGKTSGPRLAQFLLEVDRNKVCELLDV